MKKQQHFLIVLSIVIALLLMINPLSEAKDFNDLPSDILEMILDNGYTREVYDIIVKEYVVRKYVSS